MFFTLKCWKEEAGVGWGPANSGPFPKSQFCHGEAQSMVSSWMCAAVGVFCVPSCVYYRATPTFNIVTSHVPQNPFDEWFYSPTCPLCRQGVVLETFPLFPFPNVSLRVWCGKMSQCQGPWCAKGQIRCWCLLAWLYSCPCFDEQGQQCWAAVGKEVRIWPSWFPQVTPKAPGVPRDGTWSTGLFGF